MTAYGALISLRNTIDNILHCSRFSLADCSQKIIQIVHKELQPWQQILERLDNTSPSRSRKKVNALDGRIKEAIWKFEDSLESLLPQHIPSQSQSLSIDQNDVDSLIQTLKDLEKDYIYEVENMPQDEPISSLIGFHGTNSKMIGLSDQFQRVKTNLMITYLGGNHAYALYGTAGVGKTTLAMQIYQDPEIQGKYECRAWVTIGRVHQPITRISQGILAQLCGTTQGDEGNLDGKNCLIVLDDVWEREVLHCLPNIKNGCIHVLLTGRHKKWMQAFSWYELACMPLISCSEVRFLNEEESMDLLCHKVFGDEICPPQLHKAATKIAKLCEGLPLMILTVADSLSKSQNRDPGYWNEVAEKRNSVFVDAYNEISKVLFPSYEYLPQCLKMPFLFMGVFPQDYDTSYSKIMTMLTTEGLLPERYKLYEGYDWECLVELAAMYSLVLCCFKSVNKTSNEYCVHEYKTCRLHSSWRHVCRGEASKNKFYRILNNLTDASEEFLKGLRGLCLENNILFGIKEFCKSVKLNCASFTRSLLFYGPYRQYPIPIDVGFRLLREIDALTQRFYTFPIEILTLVQLKYLALTCNGEPPATISKLFNLRVLIIHPHMNIRCCKAPSCVPIQIWDMQELEQLEILGKSLVVPSHVASLEKLVTLVGVNANIGTILELSRRIPNVRKLGVQVELTPFNDHNDLFSCLVCISKLTSLKTLKCSIINPVVQHGQVGTLMFPRGLKKLHLSGMGFPWDYMDVIGSLPFLEVLKLRSYAFRGSQWEAQRRSFLCLKFLLIEDSDLVQWKPGYGSFPKLYYLSMKHCYKLEKIQRPASMYLNVHMPIEIELVDCNPLAFTCAKQLQPSTLIRFHVTVSTSFYEKPTTIKFQSRGEDYEDTLEDDYEDEIANCGEDNKGEGDDENRDEEDEEEHNDEYTYDHKDT